MYILFRIGQRYLNRILRSFVVSYTIVVGEQFIYAYVIDKARSDRANIVERIQSYNVSETYSEYSK